MRKWNIQSAAAVGIAALVAGGIGAAAPAPPAPAAGPHVTYGTFTLDARHVFGTPQSVRFFGGVHLTNAPEGAPSYDLRAEAVTVNPQTDKALKSQGFPIAAATAEGSPAKGTQVSGRFSDVVNGQAYQVLADHAVYRPDPSRPAGGSVHFTGHVKLRVSSGFLSGPSLSTVTQATVLLGQGDQYPQIDADDLHTSATPAP